MNNNKKRILDLLHNNKISENEFKLLNDALNIKDNTFIKIAKLLLNPFQSVSGTLPFICGFLLIIILALLAWIGQLHFNGLFDFKIIKHPNHMDLLMIYIELFANWILISLIFLISALILRARAYRIIDFFAFTALAQFPYLCLTIVLLIIKTFNLSLFLVTDQKTNIFSFGSFIWIGIYYSMFVWQLCLFFGAYKEATGLSNIRLWVGYFISIVLGEVISLQYVSFSVNSFLYS